MTGMTGSLLYMAPEVYQGMTYDTSIDIYSFGILMYELLTRQSIAYADVGNVSACGSGYSEFAMAMAQGNRPEIPEFVPECLGRII